MGVIKQVNDRIIRRVRGLLSLAEDNSNMEESQNAFLQAQRMMVKYGIDPTELTDDEEIREVLEKSGTEYKRLWWWERQLAHIVAKNFRCRWFYRSKHIKGKKQKQRKIVFMGTDKDVELASEMYKLVIDACWFYTNRYIKHNVIQGDRSYTNEVKNDYIRGFIDGLERKFEEQIQEQEWGLVLVVPKEVEEKYEATITGSLSYSIPDLSSWEHYDKGYEDGNAIDYKKETIDDEITV